MTDDDDDLYNLSLDLLNMPDGRTVVRIGIQTDDGSVMCFAVGWMDAIKVADALLRLSMEASEESGAPSDTWNTALTAVASRPRADL